MPIPRQAKRKLRNLTVTNVDIVPLGANHDASTGEGAHIVLWKSAKPDASAESANVPSDSSRGAGPPTVEGGQRMPQGRSEDRGQGSTSSAGQEPRYTEAEWRARTRQQGQGDSNQGRENAVEEVLGEGLGDLDEGTRQREVRERTGQAGSQATGREGDELPGQHGRDDSGSPGGRTTPVDPSSNPGVQSEDPKKSATSALEARVAEAEARSARLEKAWNERQAIEMDRVFKSKAEAFGALGDADTFAGILKACAGADRDLYEKAEKALTVAAARVEGSVVSGGLFAEVGTTKSGSGSTGDDALRFGSEGGELIAKAREIAKELSITVEAATPEAIARFPHLYGEFMKSQTAPRR